MIPLQKPLITSNNLRGKRHQAENEPVAVHQPKPKQSNAGADTSAITIENAPYQFNGGEQHSTNDADAMPLDGIVSDDQPILLPNTTTSPVNKSIKQNKRLEKKRLKQQQKQLKKLNKQLAEEKKRNDSINARAKKAAKKTEKSIKIKSDKSNKKQFMSNDGNEPQVPGSSSSNSKQKQTVNVKFAVDTVDNSANCLESRSNVNGPSEQHANGNELTNGFSTQNGNTPNIHAIGLRYAAAKRNSGEYDSLPMINVETHSNNEIYDGNGNVIRSNPIAIPFARSSSEHIPYIDESPNVRRATSVPIETRNRFITLQQRGIGAQGIIYARKIEKFNFPFNIPPKREQFDKSVQILYQSLKESIDHHFERAAYLNSKLCQVCHEFLVIPEAVKCLTCGLVCHHSCTISQVSGNWCFTLVLLLGEIKKKIKGKLDNVQFCPYERGEKQNNLLFYSHG